MILFLNKISIETTYKLSHKEQTSEYDNFILPINRNNIKCIKCFLLVDMLLKYNLIRVLKYKHAKMEVAIFY